MPSTATINDTDSPQVSKQNLKENLEILYYQFANGKIVGVQRDATGQHKCPKCKNTYSSRKSMVRHMKDKHSTENIVVLPPQSFPENPLGELCFVLHMLPHDRHVIAVSVFCS